MGQVRRGDGRVGRWAGLTGGPVGRHTATERHGHGTVLVLRALAAALLALGLVIPWGPTADADPPADPPTAEEARDARDAVAAGTLDVEQAEAALGALRSELEAATVRVQVAAADYLEALQAVEEARREAAVARSAAEKGHQGEVAARASLAEVYRASARDADLGPLGVALEAESVPDMVGRSAAERAVQRKLGGALAEYQEARAASASADARWTAAKEQRDTAAARAQAAYGAAQAATADLEARTRAAETERRALVERLAELRQTSVRIEQEREAARVAAAEAAREAAAQAELDRQERARAEAAAEGKKPDGKAPEGKAAEGKKPDGKAPEGKAPEGQAPEGKKPDGKAPDGKKPDAKAPGTKPDAGSGDAPDDSAGGDAPAGPTAAPWAPPAPVGPPTSGVTSGSAERGYGAVGWARTQLGAPYQFGAAGPTAYDCSGLTMMAWASQGVDITRTSRSQYLAVGKVGYAALRAGDLIFYGTDPSDPASIYHVALYAGGGMMIEATLPGQPLAENPVRFAGAMPYAGRP